MLCTVVISTAFETNYTAIHWFTKLLTTQSDKPKRDILNDYDFDYELKFDIWIFQNNVILEKLKFSFLGDCLLHLSESNDIE